jgi:hypothetical protein
MTYPPFALSMLPIPMLPSWSMPSDSPDCSVADSALCDHGMPPENSQNRFALVAVCCGICRKSDPGLNAVRQVAKRGSGSNPHP